MMMMMMAKVTLMAVMAMMAMMATMAMMAMKAMMAMMAMMAIMAIMAMMVGTCSVAVTTANTLWASCRHTVSTLSNGSLGSLIEQQYLKNQLSGFTFSKRYQEHLECDADLYAVNWSILVSGSRADELLISATT